MAGGNRHHSTGAQRARQEAYRQSDKGRLARKMYNLDPMVRAKKAARRRAKRQMKAGF